MNFADFIDIDRELHVDSPATDPLRRIERDRRIGRAISVSSAPVSREDEQLLLEWKSKVSGGPGNSLGSFLEGAVRWTAFLVMFFGFLAGAGAAATLLRYDGTQPINVLFFLGAIVGIQLLLLPLLIFTFLFRRRLRHGFRLARDLISGLLGQILFLLARTGASPEKAAELRADLGKLRAKNSLYARVQPLLVLLMMQVFGVAFNLAVIATLMFFVLFSDLTFSWNTTVQVEPERIHQITSVLSAPWGNWMPEAKPSRELVEATRFVRMDGAFATADPDAALRAGGWWPFLLASTVAYGLLPRLLAFLGSLVMFKREMRRAVIQNAEIQDLKERLRTPLVRVDAEPVVEAGEKAGLAAGESRPERVEKGLCLVAVFWAYDEAPSEQTLAQLLEKALGATVVNRLQAGGIDTGEEQVLEEVRQAKEDNRIAGAAVFFEPFEPPKKDALRFLARLRETMGPSAPIVVFLAEFAGGEIAPVEREDWDAWDRALRLMGDPYLLIGERQGGS